MQPNHAFDRVAARYDELWTNTAIGRAQRDLVWRDMEALFQPGERIFDIGCGTGEDAAHFAARGIAVYATDASPAMIGIAQARGGFSAAVCSAEELTQTGGVFDGAISNFGALNCVQDLPDVARSLGRSIGEFKKGRAEGEREAREAREAAAKKEDAGKTDEKQ